MYSIIFPSEFDSTKKVSSFWDKEAQAALKAGFEISLLSESHFGTPLTLTNKKSASLYRGWIIKPPVYQEMCGLGCNLINSYGNYLWSYNFPEWYKDITNEETPNSFTFTGAEVARIGIQVIAEKVSERVGSKSILIKDWLKSRKHEWFDACFIRDASDTDEVVRVMSNFFKLQGRDFYGGLVVRDFLNLKKVGIHPKSSMPLPLEFRTFFMNGKPFFTTPYWSNDVTYPENLDYPSSDWLNAIGSKIQSPFVALDIAQDENDKWWVIEVNDGGSAGLPDHVDLECFYKMLSSVL